MKPSFFILLALVGLCICEDDAILEGRSVFELGSTGPIVTMFLRWDRFTCSDNWQWYWISLCGPNGSCHHAETEEESIYFREITRPKDLLVFWTSYTIEILARCRNSAYIVWSKKKFDTGPGELYPLLDARPVVESRTTTTIIWRKQGVNPNVADSVEIKLCAKISNICLDTIRTTVHTDAHRFERLLACSEYIANVSFVKEFQRKEYRSLPVRTEFKTRCPKVPGAPQGVLITTLHGQKIVKWDEADPEFEVLFYKINATALPSRKRAIYSRTRAIFELSSLQPANSRYMLEISACTDTAGYQCGPPAFLELAAAVTGYPSRPRVELIRQNGDSVLFRWLEPTEPRGPIDGYEFAYCEEGDSFTPSNWVSVGGNERSALVSRLQAGTTYVFHVQAFNLDPKGRKLYSLPGVLVVKIEEQLRTEGGGSLGSLGTSRDCRRVAYSHLSSSEQNITFET